jgi:DNA modification methylase
VIDIRLGDCLEVLRTIPDGSARMCVTSPPYYGLRDYGVDGQIGLEATPDAFVAKMVEVFREVRRVLADDGTCWVNLGSSYASSTLRETQTPQPSRAPACGSGGIGSQDSQAVDHACLGSCGERSDETPNHRAGIVHTGRCAGPDEPPTWQTNRDSETEDCGPSSPVVSDPCDPRSTTPRSSYRPRAAYGPEDEASACLWSTDSSPLASLPSARMADCTCGTRETPSPSVHRRLDTAPSGSACDRPDCRGVGQCGYCFCSLISASLKFKTKDEVNTPHLVAMALQADGWFLRSTIIWHKPNPMPESVRDRPTKAHEYVFLLSKQPRYYYDAEAVREPQTGSFSRQGNRPCVAAKMAGTVPGIDGSSNEQRMNEHRSHMEIPGGRNARTVWTITPRPFKGAHFATFPAELAERCIKAGSSERGKCPECGAAWVRVVKKELIATRGKVGDRSRDALDTTRTDAGSQWGHSAGVYGHYETTTTGWRPICSHDLEPVPDVVLDPFAGAETVGLVCQRLGRDHLGVELNPEYRQMAIDRIASDSPMPLLESVSG